MLNIDGKLIKNPQILAETFNNYISNIVEESVIKIIKQDSNNLNKHSYMQSLVYWMCEVLGALIVIQITIW
jgi:hypothetical protein